MSILTLFIGTISILLIAKVASDLWVVITISLLALGLTCLLISWIVIKFKTIKIIESEIDLLTINSALDINEIRDLNEIQYFGNWVKLEDGTSYEIERTQILDLIEKLDTDTIQTKETKQKFYNVSPKDLVKTVLNLGP